MPEKERSEKETVANFNSGPELYGDEAPETRLDASRGCLAALRG